MSFQESLNHIMAKNNLSIRDVAHIADASLPTVRRWVSGKTSPHPIMQPNIINRLNK